MITMITTGVMVSCSAPGNSAATHCSGILLDNSWVITTGSLLSIVTQTSTDGDVEIPWEDLFKETYLGSVIRMEKKLIQDAQLAFSVLCPDESDCRSRISAPQKEWNLNALFPFFKTLRKYIPNNRESRDLWSLQRSQSALATLSAQNSVLTRSIENFKQCKANLRYIWRSPPVSQAVDTLLSSWLLGSTSSAKENSDIDAESEIAKHLFPMFLIFKLETDANHLPEEDDYDIFVKKLYNLLMKEEEEEDILKRGRILTVQSTPFGNPFFYNSISEGILSNITGPENCLILTDARTAFCSEGGPIYIMLERNGEIKPHLVGMVICSLSWWRGEWVGFTLGVALKTALHGLLGAPSPNIHTLKPSRNSVGELAFLDECMVVVRCGPGWGSGVVIDSGKGLILTCSHVVRKAKNNEVEICWKNNKYSATILFRVRDGIAYDVAILKTVPGIHFRSAILSNKAPVRGEPIVAVGFPLFSEYECSRPTLTRGIVAHVSDPEVMMQTTCCIQSGASGGALFNRTGQVVGLISCNTQDTSSGAHYPHINMAVPSYVLIQPLFQFIKTGDIQHLNALESPDTVVQRIWKMQELNSKL